MLNECNVFVEILEREREENERYWGIEINHAIRIYLSTYGRIDSIDHLIINDNVCYRNWQYWYAPKNHAIALAIVTVFDICRECCECNIEDEWMVSSKDQLDLFSFREKISSQMLMYLPNNYCILVMKKRMVTMCKNRSAAKEHNDLIQSL